MQPQPLFQRACEAPKVLTFSPLAWLKLQFFCHLGDTEIGGFGISAEHDPLYIQDFVTVRQQVTPVTVRFDDAAVADWFDRCVDQGLTPSAFARVWLHTHPGEAVTPCSTDEETFDCVFGRCDWALMFILSRTGRTYARLSFSAGPRGFLLLPVEVDWSAWPDTLISAAGVLDTYVQQWRQEFAANIDVLPVVFFSPADASTDRLSGDVAWSGRERSDAEFNDFLDAFTQEDLHHEHF